MWKCARELGRGLLQYRPSVLKKITIFNKPFLLKREYTMGSPQCEINPVGKNQDNILLPPASVRGMKELDVKEFNKSIDVPCLTVPCNKIGQVLPLVKKFLVKIRKFSAVRDDVDRPNHRQLLLDPNRIKDFTSFDDVKEKLLSCGLTEDNLASCKVHLTYENWGMEDVLKSVLPEDKDSLSSFSIIGHIAHVNLREHLECYKSFIGRVILDKNVQFRTVINKINQIDSSFRTFQIEVLAGEDDMMAKVKENGTSYEFDFSKVYWNPRLSSEHERIVKGLKPGDVLYDVFAGVGPFAIPAAKKKCIVLANDLNPESYKWLQHNIKLNKVEGKIKTFNKDGADFIREDIRTDLLEQWKSPDERNFHITMNLPAMAVEFLKYYRGLFAKDVKPEQKALPIVHVYCFTKGASDPEIAALDLVQLNLGVKLDDDKKSVHHVRNVSNFKEMMRVSFILPEEILFDDIDGDEPAPKKPCLDRDIEGK